MAQTIMLIFQARTELAPREPINPLNKSIQNHRGFTLIELLIVLILIGTVAGAVFSQVNIFPRKNALEESALNLSATIIKVMDLSQLRQKDYGLMAVEQGYQWFEFQSKPTESSSPNQIDEAPHLFWVPINPAPKMALNVELPDDIRLHLESEGAEMTLDVNYPDDDQLVPILIAQRDGEVVPPLSLILSQGQSIARLEIDGIHEPELFFYADSE